MYTVTILACVGFALITTSWATTVGEHNSAAPAFCYDDAKGCGPDTTAWAALCREGERQSPVDLPNMTLSKSILFPPPKHEMTLSMYKGKPFRIINNGHSVQFDFNNTGSSTKAVSFPNPSNVFGNYQRGDKLYRFASGHFHWGTSDNTTGSEHTIGGVASPLELHLVHYLASYGSMAEAVASGDPNALTVIGLLLDMGKVETIVGNVAGLFGVNATGPLKTIVQSLPQVAEADHSGSNWVTIDRDLDLTKLLTGATSEGLYTYQGSLTTPGCNEQVNWCVLKKRSSTSHQDLQAFRSLTKDGSGEVLTANHRPVKPLGTRTVLLSAVNAV